MNTKLTLKLSGPKRLMQESATFCRCLVHFFFGVFFEVLSWFGRGFVEVGRYLVVFLAFWALQPQGYTIHYPDHSRPTICQAASSADSQFRHLGHCLEYGESLVHRVLRHVKSAIPGSGNAWIASIQSKWIKDELLKYIYIIYIYYIVIPYNSSITRCLNNHKHDGCSRLQCGFGDIEFAWLSWGFFQLVHVVPCWQRWV